MAKFWDDLGDLGKIISKKAKVVTKKTGEVVDVVAKKTEQTVEVQKLKSQIHVMERSNDRDYKDIGKMIYDRFKKGEIVEEAMVELCEAIAEREESIEKTKREIAQIKGFDVCPSCDSHLEPNMKFCPKCGAQVDGDVADVFEEEE